MCNRFSSWIAVLAVVGVSVVGFSACGGDNPVDNSNPAAGAPALPDMSTMTMNLSFFGIQGVNAPQRTVEELQLAAGTGKDNWINAVVRVVLVQLSMYVAFQDPIGAFAIAANTVPQLQADGSWLWTFVFSDAGIDFSIFLYGTVVGDHVEWRMEVSSTDPALLLDHFVWFDGESKLDDSSGFWQFYAPVDSVPVVAAAAPAMTPGVPAVLIDWTNGPAAEHWLTLHVNLAGSPEFGDSLGFHESPQLSTIDYHDADMLEDTNITWYADGSGSITAPDYNNGATACWDTRQNDVVCP